MLELGGTRKDLGSAFDSAFGSRLTVERPAVAPDNVVMADIEAELARRFLLSMAFAPAIEARYEASTKTARAWNIRLTVAMGLVAYAAFCLVDASILPDLGWVPTLARLLVITPVGVFLMAMASRMTAGFREAYLAYAVTGAMMIPLAFIAVSEAPLAPYAMFPVLLTSMFGNITVRLRFRWACWFTAVTVASVGLLLLLRSDLPGGLAGALTIATINCVSFGLVANNQLERAERRSFLLALRESVRSRQLSVDKAMFSALSLVDALTGLPNRRAFGIRLAELQATRRIQGRTDTLLMVDVDHFKRFNDRYGHPAGDACLGRVARELEAVVVRRNDLVTRYGGEEFAVLLADCDGSDAVRIAERLCRAVLDAAIPHADRGDALSAVTISVGVACADAETEADDLIVAADRELYNAKRAGRNRVAASA